MKSLKIIILLLDEECVIVDSIGEGPGWKDSVKQKAVPGYSFHEKFSGTTAAGIAMNTGKPCQLLPEEHYCPFEIELICSAAPIHDPAQNLTGVLYVTAISDVAVKNPHIFCMVTAAAKAIEYNLSMMKETEKVVLANKFLKAAMAQISKGMMIFDSAGKLVNINMPAAKMFGFVENEVVGKVVDHLLPDTSIRELIASGRKNTFREVILSGNKRHNRYYASANNIFDDSRNCVGKALLFEQINKVKPLVHRMMGAVAEYQFSDIIGESRAIKRAVDLGLKAAECKSNVLILGESGTGKELFSQAIHNASDRHSGPFVAVSGYPDYCRLQGLPE